MWHPRWNNVADETVDTTWNIPRCINGVYPRGEHVEKSCGIHVETTWRMKQGSPHGWTTWIQHRAFHVASTGFNHVESTWRSHVASTWKSCGEWNKVLHVDEPRGYNVENSTLPPRGPSTWITLFHLPRGNHIFLFLVWSPRGILPFYNKISLAAYIYNFILRLTKVTS